MKRVRKMTLVVSLLAMFVFWTVVVCLVDVQPVGPEGAAVGLATWNRWLHNFTGVHWDLYEITDWLGLIPMGIVGGFGLLGLAQWIARRSLGKVDRSILLLGGFYLVVLVLFVLFELVPVNYRPVLVDGKLEASYPSSTTMLVLCVMPTALMEWNHRIKSALRPWIMVAGIGFMVLMVVGRWVSGVHWTSDIVGGGFLGAGLVMLYNGIKATP